MNCYKCGNHLDEQFQGLEPLCKTCQYWTSLRYSYDSVIIDGNHYSIGQNTDPTFMRGHGGRRFKIRFFDGREVITNDLWHQGAIPGSFRSDLRDNAEFVVETPTHIKGLDCVQFRF